MLGLGLLVFQKVYQRPEKSPFPEWRHSSTRALPKRCGAVSQEQGCCEINMATNNINININNNRNESVISLWNSIQLQLQLLLYITVSQLTVQYVCFEIVFKKEKCISIHSCMCDYKAYWWNKIKKRKKLWKWSKTRFVFGPLITKYTPVINLHISNNINRLISGRK